MYGNGSRLNNNYSFSINNQYNLKNDQNISNNINYDNLYGIDRKNSNISVNSRNKSRLIIDTNSVRKTENN